VQSKSKDVVELNKLMKSINVILSMDAVDTNNIIDRIEWSM
jgi:hypothetical protein